MNFFSNFVEEAKADITGLYVLQYLIDKGHLDKNLEKFFYTTFIAGAFRSIRFGLNEAHGKGQGKKFSKKTKKSILKYHKLFN